MKNTLHALPNFLFESFVRLADKSIQGEALVKNIERAEQTLNFASAIISDAKVNLLAYEKAEF